MKNQKTLAVPLAAAFLACGAALPKSVSADSFSIHAGGVGVSVNDGDHYRGDDYHHHHHYFRHEELDAALAQLGEARHHLERAGYEYDGHRGAALRSVDAAIAECRRAIDYANSHEDDDGGGAAAPPVPRESVEERVRREGNAWKDIDGRIAPGDYVEDLVEGRRDHPEGRGRIGKVLSIDHHSRHAMVDFGRDYVASLRLDDLSLLSIRPIRKQSAESAPSENAPSENAPSESAPADGAPGEPPSGAPSIPGDPQ